MNLCQFHMTETALANGHHVVRPYCGCGWTGEASLFMSIPTQTELESLGRRWEHHRVVFGNQRRDRQRTYS